MKGLKAFFVPKKEWKQAYVRKNLPGGEGRRGDKDRFMKNALIYRCMHVQISE